MRRDIPCLEWLRSSELLKKDIDETMIPEAGQTPDPSVYAPLDSTDLIVIHHSATGSGNARLFRCLHRAVNGWVDIGYHYVIGNGTCSDDGCIEKGRPVGMRGAHAKEHNHNSIGICLVGNFDKDKPTEQQMQSMGRLLRELLTELDLNSNSITLHRFLKGCNTVCPGRNLTLEMVLKSIDRQRR